MRLHAASVKTFLRTALMAALITLVVTLAVFSFVEIALPSIQLQLNPGGPVNPNLIPPSCYPNCTPAELTPTVSNPANP